MSQEEFRSFIEKLAGDYHGDTYHLINKNCNHFTDDVCQNLTGKPIPSWVNRLARVGWYLRYCRYVGFLFPFILETMGS
jgi:deubiquitinase DESI2